VSRIGKKPIDLPKGVKVAVADQRIVVEGPKGKLEQDMIPGVELAVEEGRVVVSRVKDDRTSRANQGLIRSLLANMVVGVEKGYERALLVSGVGYRAETSGNELTMFLGYSHPVVHKVPDGIEVTVEKNTRIVVKGIDRQAVGQMAAVIRASKVPDPYKIKGVLYEGERIKKKAGKKAVS
jgi:large subunit ribosomal protein L6